MEKQKFPVLNKVSCARVGNLARSNAYPCSFGNTASLGIKTSDVSGSFSSKDENRLRYSELRRLNRSLTGDASVSRNDPSPPFLIVVLLHVMSRHSLVSFFYIDTIFIIIRHAPQRREIPMT